MLALAVGLVATGFGVPWVSASEPPNQVPCADLLNRGCPDLVVDPNTFEASVHHKVYKPKQCEPAEKMTQPGDRTLIRFTFTSPNFGAGDLVVGRPEEHPEWFEMAECHRHFHFREYADYRLWTVSGYDQWNALRGANPDLLGREVLAANPDLASELVQGGKRGFCVIDIVLYDATGGPPKFLLCNFQGISRGWADEYDSDLDGQFIDVTDVPDGTYILEAEVNAEWLFKESNYTNNRAGLAVRLPNNNPNK